MYHITGTDIVRCISFRFEAFGRTIKNRKKFEEGIFSDLRGLKCNSDAVLEAPKSTFLEFLYKNSCIRTQKKQKVYYWFSVPHDRLFVDALERDMRRELNNLEPTTEAHAEPAKSFNFDLNESLYEQLMKVTHGEGVGTGTAAAAAAAGPGVGASAGPVSNPLPPREAASTSSDTSTGQIASQTVPSQSAYALSDYLSTPTEYLTSMQQQLQTQIQINQQQMASNPEYNHMVQLGGTVLHGQHPHPQQHQQQQQQPQQPQQQQQQQGPGPQHQHQAPQPTIQHTHHQQRPDDEEGSKEGGNEDESTSDFPLDYFPPTQSAVIEAPMAYLDPMSVYDQAPLSATFSAFPFDQSMNAAAALMGQQQPPAQPVQQGSGAKQYPSSIIPDYPDYELENQTYIINGKVIHGTDYRQNMVIKTPLFWDFVEGKDHQVPPPPPPPPPPQHHQQQLQVPPPQLQSQQQPHGSPHLGEEPAVKQEYEPEFKKRASSEFEEPGKGPDRIVKRAKGAFFEKEEISGSDHPADDSNDSYMLQSGPHLPEQPKSYRNNSLAASLARNGISKARGKAPPPLRLTKPGMAPLPASPGPIYHNGMVQPLGSHGSHGETSSTPESYNTIIGEDGLPHYVQRE